MKILIAPDSFKESLTALAAANAIAKGIKKTLPNAECQCLPLADGGEGTAQTLLDACGGKWRTCQVQNPRGKIISARYALLNDGRAVIEMAEAAGLQLLTREERNPLLTSTFGVGELFVDALEQGCQEIILAIGGSATNDAGVGFLSALGWRFYDQNNQLLPTGGAALRHLQRIEAAEVKNCRITVACDVNNPLCGENGASRIFAPQKGANAAQVEQLEQALQHFAAVSKDFFGQNFSQQAGTGAAGGLGFALQAFLGAEMRSGFALVAEAVGLEKAIASADLIITGEGQMDGQTAAGKVPSGVLQISQRYQIPVIAIVGVLAGKARESIDNDLGFKAIFPSIAALTSQQEALENGAKNLERTAANVASILQIATHSNQK